MIKGVLKAPKKNKHRSLHDDDVKVEKVIFLKAPAMLPEVGIQPTQAKKYFGSDAKKSFDGQVSWLTNRNNISALVPIFICVKCMESS